MANSTWSKLLVHGFLIFVLTTFAVVLSIATAVKVMQWLGVAVVSTLTYEVIGQIAAIIVGVVTLFLATQHQSYRELENAKREIYQRFELAAIDLFRFEAEHKDLIRPLWEAGTAIPEEGTAEYVAFQNYVCQNLNLLEMAARLRKQGIMPEDVFDSWVGWFYELCSAPNFPAMWERTKHHYMIDLQEIIRLTLAIVDQKEPEEERRSELSAALAKRGREIRFERLRHLVRSGPGRVKRLLGVRRGAPESEPALTRKISIEKRFELATPRSPEKDLTIGWCSDPAAADELASFFAREVTPAYISHGEIQSGRATDLSRWTDGLEAVLAEQFRHAISGGGRAPVDTRIVNAYVDGLLGGLAVVSFHRGSGAGYAVLEDVVVNGSLRGRGIGSSIIRWLEKYAREQRLSYIFIESGVRNEPAHEFFKKHGFVQSSVVMLKRIEPPVSVQRAEGHRADRGRA